MITHTRTLATVIVALTMLAVVMALFTHVDFYPALHTYGVSIGTNTHYLSVEMVRWHLHASMEAAS